MNYTVGDRVLARAVSGELGYAGNGSEEVTVKFQILEGPDVGKTITWWAYFSDKSADYTLDQLSVAGWDGVDVSVLNGLGSQDVHLKIGNEVNQRGETVQKVRWVNPTTGPVAGGSKRDKAPMSAADKAAFAAKMKGRTLHLQKQAPPPANTQLEDDIPF